MSHLYCACYIPRPSHRSSFDQLSNIQMQGSRRDQRHGGSSAADCSYLNSSNYTGCSNSWMSHDVPVTFVREVAFILSVKISLLVSLTLIPSCIIYPFVHLFPVGLYSVFFSPRCSFLFVSAAISPYLPPSLVLQ